MSTFPLVGEWPCYRRNSTLDAHSPLRGKIVQPHIAWKQFVGATENWSVIPGNHQGQSPTDGNVPKISDTNTALLSDPRWGLVAPSGEIAGHLQPLTQNTTTTYAHVLPHEPGIQKIEFESAFTKTTKNGDWAHDCVGRCYVWKGGQWVLSWQTEPIDNLFIPQPIVGDFDGDGRQEIAILPWKELLLLDAQTGKIKDRCYFTEGRIYGFFGVYDLDGDGMSEFVIQADFAKHVDVLGYRNGKLTLLWQQEIEMDISNPQKILRVPPEPAVNVVGKKKKEVLVSLFNGTGDDHWHLTIHDGMTGTVITDIKDEYLQGVVDVDGDGVCELLTIHTPGAGVPTYGLLHVWSVKEGKVTLLWEEKQSAWQIANRPQPPHINSGATLAGQDILARKINGRMRVVLRHPVTNQKGEPEVQLRICDWQSGGFREVKAGGRSSKRIVGADIATIAMDAEGQILVNNRTTSSTTRKESTPGTGAILASVPKGVPPVACTVAWERGARVPTILVSGSVGTEEIVCFHPPVAGQPAQEPRRVRGRGLGFNWPQAQMYGPVVADLFGDGRRQHLYATSSPNGYARFRVTDLNAKEIWHQDFPEIPGTPPIWNTGGIVYWQVGHFTDPTRQDVLVTVRRSMMHSEETLLLSGKDGRMLWRRERQETSQSRGVGGTPFAIADFDGDGLDDIVCLHPSDFYIIQGKTGKNLLLQDASWSKVPGSMVYWGIPIAGDFEGTGRNGVYFGTERRSLTGLLRADGSLVWWDARDTSTTCLPVVGNFTGAGKKEIVGIGFDDGIRCYDAATGTVLWRLANPAAGVPSETASADINGDGRDECLFTAGHTLYCIGSVAHNGKMVGEVLWKCDLPATVGPPVIADVEGHGIASILLVGADGWVYCVQ